MKKNKWLKRIILFICVFILSMAFKLYFSADIDPEENNSIWKTNDDIVIFMF